MPGMAPKVGGTTMHGDCYGGWNKDVKRDWNKNCSNALWDCSLIILAITARYPEFRLEA